MKPQEIELLVNRDESALRAEYAAHYGPVFQLITENHGSVDEARNLYSEAFIIFLQIIDKEGAYLKAPAETILYSIARRLWLKVLSARKVDSHSVVHHHEFIQLDGVFEVVEALNQSEELLDREINVLGEPCRTLVLEVVGRQKALDQVSERVGFTDRSRAESQLISCLTKVLKNIQGIEEVSLDPGQVKHAWQQMLGILPEAELAPYELEINQNAALAEFEGSLLTLRGQIVAFVSRRDWKTRMVQYQKELLPEHYIATGEINGKNGNMKSSKALVVAVVLSVLASVITAWIVVSVFFTDKKVERIEIIREERETPDVNQAPRVESEPATKSSADSTTLTALAITRDGYFITSGTGLASYSALRVVNAGTGKNYKVSVASTFDDLGLTLLKVDDEAFHNLAALPFRFASEDAALGQEIFCLSIEDGYITYRQSHLNRMPLSGREESNAYFSDFEVPVPGGSPVISAAGNFIGTAVGSENGVTRIIKSPRLLKKVDSLQTAGVFQSALPRYNYLYNKTRTEQVEKLEPFIFQVKLFY